MFPHHEVSTVPELGWASLPDGTILALAGDEFNVFLTADQNIEVQQKLSRFNIAMVVLMGRSNDLADLEPLIPDALSIVETIRPGEVEHVRV